MKEIMAFIQIIQTIRYQQEIMEACIDLEAVNTRGSLRLRLKNLAMCAMCTAETAACAATTRSIPVE